MSCNIFLILLLCCTWVVLGEGVVINGKRGGITLLPVIPSDTIYAYPREYVTVSLNVEYRNDTKCKIVKRETDLTNDLFKRVGACGFRGLADKIKGVTWTIIAETKLSHQYRGEFSVKTDYSERTKIYFYKNNPRPVIPLDVIDSEYCNIRKPHEKNINNLKRENNQNPEYVIGEKEKYSGKWVVNYFNNTNQKFISKEYDVIFKEKIEPVIVVKRSKNSTWSTFECSVNFASIIQCSFHGPSGIIINEGIDNNSQKFDYEVIDKGASGHPKCVLTIYNLTVHEEGQWKCSLRDETEIVNGTHMIGDRFKKSTVNIFQKLGSNFDLNCTPKHKWTNCEISHEDRRESSESFTNLPRPDDNDEGKTCSKKFTNATKELNGNWQCTVLDNKEINYEITFIVRITEDFALADVRYKDYVLGINQTILEARPFPTDENKMKNITNCAWTHPTDNKYLSNPYYYIMSNENNVCKIIMMYPQEYDKGNWTCTMTLRSSNGDWDASVAVFNVYDIKIHSKFWLYIASCSPIILIHTIIVILLAGEAVTIYVRRERQRRRFKEIFNGDLNKTTKPPSSCSSEEINLEVCNDEECVDTELEESCQGCQMI